MLRFFIGILLLVVNSMVVPCRGEDQFPNRVERYRLQSGDVIVVTYRYSPEYNATVSLQPDGYVTLPLIGELNLVGLTLAEAHSRLISKASERLNCPEVNLDLKDFQKPYYIVGGQVGAPGKFEYRGPITALRAIQLAGGFKDTGKASQILLIRPISKVDSETRLINLKNVLDKHKVNEDIALRSGDLLLVPKTRIAKIEPIIRMFNPASYGLYVNPAGF